MTDVLRAQPGGPSHGVVLAKAGIRERGGERRTGGLQRGGGGSEWRWWMQVMRRKLAAGAPTSTETIGDRSAIGGS